MGIKKSFIQYIQLKKIFFLHVDLPLHWINHQASVFCQTKEGSDC